MFWSICSFFFSQKLRDQRRLSLARRQRQSHSRKSISPECRMVGVQFSALIPTSHKTNVWYLPVKSWKFWKTFNPLWGHSQEYKIKKTAILKERLLSEKRSPFAYYNLTLSESVCLTDHEKQIQKFVAHWKVCQKSSQRELIRKNAYMPPKPQGVLLPALHIKFSRSLTNFQASPARHSSLRSKDRHGTVVQIAAGIERWQTVHFQLSKPDTKTRTAYNSIAERGDEGKRNFRRPKWQFFSEWRSFQSVNSVACLSAACTRKMATLGNHNYQKIRLECAQVAIDRNRSMASQRVKENLSIDHTTPSMLNKPNWICLAEETYSWLWWLNSDVLCCANPVWSTVLCKYALYRESDVCAYAKGCGATMGQVAFFELHVLTLNCNPSPLQKCKLLCWNNLGSRYCNTWLTGRVRLILISLILQV